jgi:hypothetical protein
VDKLLGERRSNMEQFKIMWGRNNVGKDGVRTTPFIGPLEEKGRWVTADSECSLKMTIFKDGTGEEEAGATSS